MNGNVDTADYKAIKQDIEGKISVLEARVSEHENEMISLNDLQKILRNAIDTLTKIDTIYCKSESSIQRKIIGSIYPKKFTFEDLKHRTVKINETFNFIYLINNNLNTNKNGTIDQNLSLSREVFLNGFEPLSSEPESDMLPLHHRKVLLALRANINKIELIRKFIAKK